MGAGGALGFLSGGNTPQDWGQGIQNAPFTPYFTGPGTVPQGGGPDPNFNQATPGYAENYFQQNQQAFGQPTQAGSYWQQVQGTGSPQTTNYSGQAYTGFQKPNLATDPGLDPYYDRARSRLSADLNNQYGSRGMYGSSAALSGLSEGLGGLNAEQANREADFKMRQMAEQRAWEALGGQLAGQADAGSRAGSQNELAWMMGLGNLAQGADQSQLAQLMGGMNAAMGAQGMAMDRGQNYFNNTMGPALAMAGMTGDMYNSMLQADMQMMNNALMMESGLAQAALQASLYNQGRQKDDASWAKGMLNGKGGKGGK